MPLNQNLMSPEEYQSYIGSIDQVGMTDPEYQRMIGAYAPSYDEGGTLLGYNRPTQPAAPVDAGNRAIDIQREQFYAQQEMQRPFTELGQNALAGFGQYRRTPEFDMMLGQGTQAINRGAAAGGMFNSSATGGRMADFVNQLTGDTLNRQYQQQLNALKIGQGAVNTIGGASAAFGQNAANIYGQQGQLAAQNALNKGNQQAAIFNTIGGLGAGLGNYLAMQPPASSFNFTPQTIAPTPYSGGMLA